MKVVFFSTLDNAPWGGSEVLWYRTALYMLEKGIQVSVYVKEWGTPQTEIIELKKCGAHIFFHTPKSVKGTLRRVLRKLAPTGYSFKKIVAEKPDFIFFSQSHSYDLGYYIKNWVIALTVSRIPYAVICQNNTDYAFIPEKRVRENISLIYKNARQVFFVSERNKTTAQKVICKAIDNAEIISNGYSFSETPEFLPYPENEEMQFACVARLRCSHKGQNILFDVLSRQKWAERHWQLNLYGTGEDENYLRDLAKFMGISDRVHFLGQVSDIKSVWLSNHILLLASFGEGLPLAMQEAMLCGRAVMATDVGGVSELVKEGITGWLADGANFTSVDKAMERAFADIENWKAMGEAAHALSVKRINLTPEKTLANYAAQSITKYAG